VRGVSWAPGGQRGYELIATGSKNGVVRVYALTETEEGVSVGGGAYTVELMGELEHNGVMKVEWNFSGTVLSSCGDDGRIRIWKEDHLGKWRQQYALSAEQ
jgi:nucleoporin SEH1